MDIAADSSYLTFSMLHNLTMTVETLQQQKLSVTNFLQQGHTIRNSGNQASAGNLQINHSNKEDNNLTFEILQVNHEHFCGNIQQNSTVVPASATSFRTETAIGGLNMGQCMENLSNTGVQLMQNALPLGSMVNEATKNKIWANEYIELGTLFPKLSQKSGSMPIILDNNLSSFGKPQLAVKKKYKGNKNFGPMDVSIFCFHGYIL
jgi:hypothetical protein